MQESFSIPLPHPFVSPLDEEQLGAVLAPLFSREGAGYPLLAAALQQENKPRFGPSTISNIAAGVVNYNPDGLNGRLRVRYDMQLTFGCEDLIKDHTNQHSYYNFKLNLLQHTLCFESDVPDALSTADEF